MSTHSTSAETGLDIDVDDFPPYAEVSFVQAPVSNPTSGQLYGANGYQVGIDVGDLNYYYEGGTTSDPSENTGKRVVLNHTDHSTFAFGQEFFGYRFQKNNQLYSLALMSSLVPPMKSIPTNH